MSWGESVFSLQVLGGISFPQTLREGLGGGGGNYP